MTVTSTSPDTEPLRYALDVNEKPSGSALPEPEADSGAAWDTGSEPAGEITPGACPVDQDTVTGSISRIGPISAFMNATNQRPDVIRALRHARRQLPGDPAFGDPLSVTGPGGARVVARAAERLVGDSPSAAREIGFGALQVWQAALERLGRGKGTEEMTVMFTDLVSFSSWSLTAGDEATLRLLRTVARAIEPPIADRGGQVVKRMGDGVMAVFPSADRAVEAAVAARGNLAAVRVDGYQPRMRIGLHTGSPREIGGDWLGVDVTIAARVMEAAGNGRMMASQATLDALEPETLAKLGRSARPYRRGFFAAPLSGIPEDLRIYRLSSRLRLERED